ncbi:MAG: phosphate acyltransferase PlsX [Oscillospiraceae bacterium]
MKIIVDAFGGDNAPLEIIKGCIEAKNELGIEVMLVGDEVKIKTCANENSLDISKMQIKQADAIMEMTDHPTSILKAKSNTSMAVGLKSLAQGEGDAFVSAGSTGALLAGGTFIVKRIKGVKRAAIAGVMPSAKKAFMLIDTGANVDSTVPMLCQFATLGNVYMKKIMGYENPKVALANIGTEETKGTALQIEAYKALSEMKNINFTGNIEAREIAFGEADIVVADGFTGNIILKMYEGVAKCLTNEIKDIFKKNLGTKIAYLGVKSGMDEFKSKMDYKQYGGAPLIGLEKPVFKAHGSSDARAIKNAIKQAVTFVDGNVIEEIKTELAKTKVEE